MPPCRRSAALHGRGSASSDRMARFDGFWPREAPSTTRRAARRPEFLATVDITERKRADLALTERNAQLAMAGQAALVGSYAYEADLERMTVSEGTPPCTACPREPPIRRAVSGAPGCTQKGVALLLTMVVEIISCCGLAGLSALRSSRDEHPPSKTPAKDSFAVRDHEGGKDLEASLAAAKPSLPKPSLDAVPAGRSAAGRSRSGEASNPPSNVVPMRPLASTPILPKGGLAVHRGEPSANLAAVGSHVTKFIVERLQNARGASIAAKELRFTYASWCAAQGHTPLSQPKFAAELRALGYDKWKSCGLIRYRDLQVA
jgi:hypothetical protein